MYQKVIDLDIAGLAVKLRARENINKALRLPYSCFLSRPKKISDLVIDVEVKKCPVFEVKKPVFDTEYSWALYDLNKGYLYCDKPRQNYLAYVRKVIIGKSFNRAVVFCSKKALREKGLCNWVLDLPLGQFLISNILADKESLLIHSCAVKYKNKGFMFIGPSGAGKSTLAGIWRKRKDAAILSDERVILRRIKNKLFIYGTPWPGSGFAFAAKRVVLDRIYLIEHSLENFIKPVSVKEALPVFLSNIRLPLWDKEKTKKTIAVTSGVLLSVPLFKMGFKPGQEILDYLCG